MILGTSVNAVYFLGIDPGQTGGVSILDFDGNLVDTGQFDALGASVAIKLILQKHFTTYHNPQIGLEEVHAFPGQGLSSTFKFGTEYGKLIGCLETLGLQYRGCSPQSWQKILTYNPDGPKSAVKTFCEARWGLAPFIRPGCRVPHQGCMDAAGIAEYMRQLHLSIISAPKSMPRKHKSVLKLA